MNYSGVVFEKMNFWQPDHQVEQALVTEDRMLLNWRENGILFSSRLVSTDGGCTYEGVFGAPVPMEDWEIKAFRYSAPNADAVLLVQWQQHDHGLEGCCVVRLTPQNTERRKRKVAPAK